MSIYAPVADVFTLPERVISHEISPSSVSLAVAPASVYVLPYSTFSTPLPERVITGIFPATTFTVLVT